MTKRPVSHDITWTWTSKWKEQEENLWKSQGYLHYYAQLSVKIYILCIIFWRHENVLPCLRAILIASTNGLTMCCTSSITDTTSGHQPYITKSTDWTVRKQHSPWFSQVFRQLLGTVLSQLLRKMAIKGTHWFFAEKYEIVPSLTSPPHTKGWLKDSWRYPDSWIQHVQMFTLYWQVQWVPSDTTQFVTWGSELRHYQVFGHFTKLIFQHSLTGCRKRVPWQCWRGRGRKVRGRVRQVGRKSLLHFFCPLQSRTTEWTEVTLH